jgi:hypothetical protein
VAAGVDGDDENRLARGVHAGEPRRLTLGRLIEPRFANFPCFDSFI